MTSGATRISSAALVALCALGMAGTDEPLRRDVPAVYGTAERTGITTDVVATFISAGLGDPGVAAVHYDATEPWCDSRFATVIHATGGSTVVVCAGVDHIRHVVLHEFAHAWAYHHLDETTIDDFLVLRGLTTWAGEDVALHLSGSEHAAEVITWGLAGDPGPVLRLPDRTCGGLATAFTLLAGVAPITPLEGCNPAF